MVYLHISQNNFAPGMLVIGCQSFRFILAFITIFFCRFDMISPNVAHSTRPNRNETPNCGAQKCTAHEIHAEKPTQLHPRPVPQKANHPQPNARPRLAPQKKANRKSNICWPGCDTPGHCRRCHRLRVVMMALLSVDQIK